MNLSEYATYDAVGLAQLVARGEVSPRELARTAAAAISTLNPAVKAVVETYDDRIESLDERALGHGPFRGVPFLIKDFLGHERGRRTEFGSRLCQGLVAERDTYLGELFKAAGLNIIGRSAAPEYSLVGTTESVLYGNTSNPWRLGYSPGGSTGGGMAAVASGMVPLAHGGDIAGSIRVPASHCGGVGLKPSRGRVSFGPSFDENGFGLGQNFVQARSVRDVAAMLDCLATPQVGDPFVILKPVDSYLALTEIPAPRLRIGWSTDPLMGVEVDREIVQAVERTASALAEMGHEVVDESPRFDGDQALFKMTDVWFFGLDVRIDDLAAKSGRTIGPDTLEPLTLMLYEHAKQITPRRFLTAVSAINAIRRRCASYFETHDVWLCPTTSRVAEPWGTYGLGRMGITMDNFHDAIVRIPFQFTIPFNILGAPAISLPLSVHSSGLPIGIQLGARPANEHLLVQLSFALESAAQWTRRVPPMHVSFI